MQMQNSSEYFQGTNMFRTCVIVSIAIACGAASAQTVYKCKDATGKKVFSDQPCGVSVETINIKPPRGETPDGWRDDAWERQYKNLKQRERVEAEGEQRLREIREINKPLDNLAADRKTRRCSNLRRELDEAEATVRNGAVAWVYNRAKSSINALQNQIAREC